ncbi:hypothetical protein [Antribacter gilvus]|uniref:hypothetical protein n=1 Tax=Antribacter gilvus TaxID=2304675 RepID=UPI000F79CEE6|nr:hypothetical protein [Antribacter gilvus]
MRESLSVLFRAGRLLGAHWPALVVLGLLGVAVRNGALWGAVELSQWNSPVAQILLIVAPLGYLVPVVAMLLICSRSLPNLARARAAQAPMLPSERRERRLIDVALSVLVPFLLIYEVEGNLQADRARFINEVSADELFNDLFAAEGQFDPGSRIGVLDGPTLIAIVIGVFVLRWLLGLLESKVRFLGFAILGGCMEIYWTGQAAAHLERLSIKLEPFFEERQLVATATAAFGTVEERVGPDVEAVLGMASTALGTAIESVDVALVAPLAWLAIGAVVLGHKLMDPPSTEHRILDRLGWLPAGIREILASLTEDLRARFSALWQGIRLIGRGGLGPIVLFVLGYLLAMRATAGVGWLVRGIGGPVETTTWTTFSAMEVGAGLVIAMVLAAVLIAASVDALVERGLAVPDDDRADAGGGPAAPAAPADAPTGPLADAPADDRTDATDEIDDVTHVRYPRPPVAPPVAPPVSGPARGHAPLPAGLLPGYGTSNVT